MAPYLAAIALKDVPREGFVPVEVQGTQILLGRVQDRLFACLDRCPHAAAPLSQGRLTGCEIMCARHGWVFDVLTGDSIPGPTAFRLTQFPVKIEGPQVLISM